MTLSPQAHQNRIVAVCPNCGKDAIILVSETELNKIRSERGLIQKAILHKDHVVIVYVDGQCRIRRTYAYDTENIANDQIKNLNKSERIIEDNNIPDLGSLLEVMLNHSKTKD